MSDMNKFFGAKLNTVLLLVLIILMVIAIKIMLRNEATYLPFLASNQTQTQTPPIEGNKDDLVSFSILPGTKVHGVVSYRGVVKNSYFFEANILVGVLDANKKNILQSNAHSTTDWMTSGPVSFEGNLDFSKLTKGPAFIELHNDNASGIPAKDKSILIPIVIE